MTLVMLVFLPLVSFRGYDKKLTVRWAVQKTSSLKIEGSSNVNRFACEVQGYFQTDTIAFTPAQDVTRVVPLSGSLTVDVAGFDCQNRMLTKDLRKTLRSDAHPKLEVRFISLERIPFLQDNKDQLKGVVEVELAGVSKRFEIDYSLLKQGGNLQLDGHREFNFSDFRLKAPQRLGGMIRVKDQFNVRFHLNLQQVR